jgi:amidase
VHFQDTPAPVARTVTDLAATLDSIVGYDPKDPFTVTASAAHDLGGYAQAVARDIPLHSWRIGVLETGVDEENNPDADPVTHVIRAAVSQLEELRATTTRQLEIADLAEWIDTTSVHVKQSKADISDFLAQRRAAPVSSFMEIYDGRHFHPLNDLFHGIADGPDTTDGDLEYLQRRLNQEHFRRHVLNIFAVHGLDFLVYPTVPVIPPPRNELADEKYQCLTFPTNTVIGSPAGQRRWQFRSASPGTTCRSAWSCWAPRWPKRRCSSSRGGWEKATHPRHAPAI